MPEWKEIPSYLLEPPEHTVTPVHYYCDWCNQDIGWGDSLFTFDVLHFCSEDCALKWFNSELEEDAID